MYNFDLRPLFYFLLFVGGATIGLIWLGISFFTDNSIKSNTKINPKIELVIKDNKIDTIYVYKK